MLLSPLYDMLLSPKKSHVVLAQKLTTLLNVCSTFHSFPYSNTPNKKNCIKLNSSSEFFLLFTRKIKSKVTSGPQRNRASMCKVKHLWSSHMKTEAGVAYKRQTNERFGERGREMKEKVNIWTCSCVNMNSNRTN
ncbi:hypothetical protein ACKWTF_015973 [Chironomus riparius]